MIEWEALLEHRGHTHYLLTGLNGTVAGFKVPSDHSSDTFLTITVTATDSGGLTASETVSVRPRTAPVRIESSPAGAPVTFAGADVVAPAEAQHAVGFETVLSAARAFERDGVRYVFRRWSDGRRRTHPVTVAADGLSVRARYAPSG